MDQLVAYHRPRSHDEAVGLLRAPGRRALGGGTTFRHHVDGDPIELVDLQALDLGDVRADHGDRWSLGAMARLQDLVDDPAVPELVRWAARAELPSTLRTLATVGGTVGAGDPESVLLAALLAHDATVRFADGPPRPLTEVLASGVGAGALVVAVDIAGSGRTAHAVTGRTPADTPIVAALGRVADDAMLRIALTGVAEVPVLVDPDGLHDLDPPGDFRGSSPYRRHLAAVLTARVREALS